MGSVCASVCGVSQSQSQTKGSVALCVAKLRGAFLFNKFNDLTEEKKREYCVTMMSSYSRLELLFSQLAKAEPPCRVLSIQRYQVPCGGVVTTQGAQLGGVVNLHGVILIQVQIDKKLIDPFIQDEADEVIKAQYEGEWGKTMVLRLEMWHGNVSLKILNDPPKTYSKSRQSYVDFLGDSIDHKRIALDGRVGAAAPTRLELFFRVLRENQETYDPKKLTCIIFRDRVAEELQRPYSEQDESSLEAAKKRNEDQKKKEGTERDDALVAVMKALDDCSKRGLEAAIEKCIQLGYEERDAMLLKFAISKLPEAQKTEREKRAEVARAAGKARPRARIGKTKGRSRAACQQTPCRLVADVGKRSQNKGVKAMQIG